jgi:hypothetical protein
VVGPGSILVGVYWRRRMKAVVAWLCLSVAALPTVAGGHPGEEVALLVPDGLGIRRGESVGGGSQGGQADVR